MSKKWFVYIITNYRNTVFYTGITNNLSKRIWEHKKSINRDSFSSKYRLYKLLWFQEFSNPNEAIAVEKKVKDYRREKKIFLIKKINPNLTDLFSLR